MILAAGKGERMRPLTLETPKPLLEAGGKALIAHHLDSLSVAGFTDLVINHAWLGDKLEEALGSGQQFGVNIAWSREGEPLETAGGIIKALPLLTGGDDCFVCVNGDIWTDFNFGKLPVLDGKTLLAWLVLVPNPPQHSHGDFVLDQGLVREPRDGEAAYTYSGIAVYHPALFAGISPGRQSIVPLLKAAMAQGRVGGEMYSGQWFDIGTPERLQALDLLLQQ